MMDIVLPVLGLVVLWAIGKFPGAFAEMYAQMTRTRSVPVPLRRDSEYHDILTSSLEHEQVIFELMLRKTGLKR